MGKVLVLESDKRQLESMKLLLDSKKINHEIFYASNPGDAIECAISNRINVIVCSIDLKLSPSIEFIDYIYFVLPNVLCIYLSDCTDIKHTVMCMNRKKPFAFVSKPIFSIDDILVPMDQAVAEAERRYAVYDDEISIDEELERLTEDLKKMQFLMQNNKQFYDKVNKILIDLIEFNSNVSNASDEKSFSYPLTKEYIEQSYQRYTMFHVMEEYAKDETFLTVKKLFNKPDYKCYFDIVTLKNISTSQYCFKELLFSLYMLGAFVSNCLIEYNVCCHIVELGDSYVIDQKMEPTEKLLYRIPNQDLIDNYARITKFFLQTVARVDRFYDKDNPFNCVIKIEKKEY